MRPRSGRLLDLRLLVPVLVAWPLVAFWGLVAPPWCVVLTALAALGGVALAALASRRAAHRGWA
ncbi:MAG: hypothetical protein HOQ21_05490, partial [Dermatophilaceae bacterium]|nr:hypothetical protein [Dermatophilaceae bacterium]